MHRLLAILLICLPGVAPLAQTIRGAGVRPCTDWTIARRGGGRDFEAEQWTLGYLSGLNAAAGPRQGRLFSLIEEKDAFAAVDTYCVAHPSEMLWNALRSAIAAHGA